MVFRVRDGVAVGNVTVIDVGKNLTANSLSVDGDVYSKGNVGFANTDGTRKVHMVYNSSSNSLDTVFE